MIGAEDGEIVDLSRIKILGEGTDRLDQGKLNARALGLARYSIKEDRNLFGRGDQSLDLGQLIPKLGQPPFDLLLTALLAQDPRAPVAALEVGEPRLELRQAGGPG